MGDGTVKFSYYKTGGQYKAKGLRNKRSKKMQAEREEQARKQKARARKSKHKQREDQYSNYSDFSS
jgi:hypothetical protein